MLVLKVSIKQKPTIARFVIDSAVNESSIALKSAPSASSIKFVIVWIYCKKILNTSIIKLIMLSNNATTAEYRGIIYIQTPHRMQNP